MSMDDKHSSTNRGNAMATDDEILIATLIPKQRRALKQVQEFLNLEEEEVVKAFEKIFLKHKDLITKLLSEGEHKPEYAVVMIMMPLYEQHVRGQLKLILSTIADEEELVARLTSLHRDISDVVYNVLCPEQTLPDPLEDFRLQEKESFTKLLKEITSLIRSRGKINLDTLKADASIQTPVDHVPDRSSSSDEVNHAIKQEQIIVNQPWIEAVFGSLKLFVETEQHPLLKNLLEQGENQDKIKFYGKQNILVDLFSRLFSNGHLTGTGSQEALARWLSNNFCYKNGEKFCEVNPRGAIQIISKYQNIPPDNERLCLRDGLNDVVSSKKRVSRT
jgi:hypothetical protein